MNVGAIGVNVMCAKWNAVPTPKEDRREEKLSYVVSSKNMATWCSAMQCNAAQRSAEKN